MDLLTDIAQARFLPPYFHVVGELLSLLSKDNSEIGDIVHLVESDQSIASRTLTIVNSPFYGLPRQIGRLDEAVIFLGMNELRNAVLAVAMHDLTGGVRKEEWMHSLSVAYLAERLYKAQSNQIDADLKKWVFASGLLHDIGKLFLSRRYMEAYNQILSMVKHGPALLSAEVEVFGYDHAAVGAMMLNQWNIPQLIVLSVSQHHSADGSPLAQIVRRADQVALLMELPREKAEAQVEAAGGIGWDELSGIVAKAIEKSSSFNGAKT